MIRNWRAWLVALGAVLVATVGFAGPAAADVTVTPSQAPRGGPAELTFHIPDDRAGVYTTKVELVPPEATPIAEIYPMSVNDWAPSITTRKLDHPVDLIHGSPTTEVPSAVTWIRVGPPPAGPSAPIELTVSLGPMPDGDRVAFTVVQTYSDGSAVRWTGQPGAGSTNPAPTVTLVDEDVAGNAGGADGGHAHAGGGQPDGQPGDYQAAGPKGGSGDGGTYGILGAGLLVGLVAGLGLDGWIILRAVRRATASGPAPSK